MNELAGKLKEVLASVLPITFIVLVLHFTLSPLEPNMLYAFLIGSALVIIGLTVFLFGIDQGLEPIGRGVGNAITHSNSYAVIITVSLILGFFISYAEPDLHILANQVDSVTSGQFDNTLMVAAVSIGIGVMMTFGMLRILKNIRLKYVFIGAYALIFILSFFSSPDFLAIAFDASGATTGAITVPFMLALAAGVSAVKKGSKVSEADSFGLVGISSTGAILGVLVAGFFLKNGKLDGVLPEADISSAGLLYTYSSKLLDIAWESFLTLLPIIIVYIVFQLFFFKQKKRKVIDITRGIVFTYAGLVVFLLGVNGGFMAVGTQLGLQLAAMDSDVPVLIVALLLGLTTVLAEPAVHVLTNQVEEVTGGSVRRRLVLIFLSVAVGLSIFMSALRILIPGIRLWMYLLPGFGLAALLAFFVPDLFVGMAYDAGGVASGPMTATFSLAFVQGVAAHVPTADVVSDGFGMIAIVAMMPIIAIELLGAIYKAKSIKASKGSVIKKQSTGGKHG
ncbi:MAG: DUF1538 domain-containing protein [Clostridiales bacterium]|nr:DUF1538 domain-containing protein [Clostridiales bacterium]